MQKLNFPNYQFRFKSNKNKRLIFDGIRKKFFILTPEEWVRQHVINYLVLDKTYPASHLSVEKQLKLHETVKRYDIVVYNREGGIELIVECKAPSIKISQDTFDQIARYNHVLRSKFLMVTNGLDHYFCKMDFKAEKYEFIKELP
jgi:hypothetical protein